MSNGTTYARAADYYKNLPNGKVLCKLCPHNCAIEQGKTGICLARENVSGKLYAQSYGAVTSAALDPIEKKPLRHFLPGSRILSIGSYGCNLHCGFCQNSSISMQKTQFTRCTPEDIAAKSAELFCEGNIGVAYTYNEPLIGFEFVKDCAELIRAQGQKNVLVTNGFVAKKPLEELLPLIDAANIDLKSFSEDFYREVGGELPVVLSTIETFAKACHVEITTLIIPGKNDSVGEMREISGWIAGISPKIPLHISRFFPSHKWRDIQPTPPETVLSLAETAREFLEFVYVGNL